MTITVRNERPGDVEIIRHLTELAFRGRPYSCKREHLLIDDLRAANALTVSLVASADLTIIGHVALSPVSLSGASGPWFGLGPISVLPEWQGKGIGSALMKEALARLTQHQAAGCILVGNPRFYKRFGFVHDPSIVAEGEPPEYTMIFRLSENSDHGIARFHDAFHVK
jgi:predicted N-acetyltransferase YhbS